MSKHSRDAIRAAFAALRNEPDCEDFVWQESKVSRWLTGTRPQRRSFAAGLARVLEDPSLLTAYDQDGPSHADEARLRGIVSKAATLPPVAQRRLIDYVRALPNPDELSMRRDMTVDVELDQLSPGLLSGTADLRWHGAVPQDAAVHIATDTDHLDEVFADPSCIYRDLVDLTPDDLRSAYAMFAEHHATPLAELSWRDRRTGWTTAEAYQDAVGVMRFSNPPLASTDVRLKVRFPYPEYYGLYIVRLGSYAVRGPAHLSLRLGPRVSSTAPRAYVAAHPCEVRREDDEARRSVRVELGVEDELLPVSPSILFYWAVTNGRTHPADDWN